MTGNTTIAEDLHDNAVKVLPGGVNSNVRLANATAFFARGDGAWLYDVDGNDYVDYLLGQGPNFLGHAPKEVVEAVADACRDGMVFGGQHPLEVQAAEQMIGALGWPDMVRLGLTGTEMVQAALRLARAVTGRRRFVRFEGTYHGWLDNVLTTLDGTLPITAASDGQLGDYLDDSIIVPFNDPTSLVETLEQRSGELAAVLVEPMMCNAGAILPQPGFLDEVRRQCDAHGVVLIFDEVICGFRLALGGAAERFGVTPDLGIYGKAMAGGWPVAALAGKGELMERIGTGVVNHSGTFNGSVMAAAATVATLDRLTADPPYARIEAHGSALMDGIRAAAATHDIPLHLQGLPMAFHASVGADDPIINYRDLTSRNGDAYAQLSTALGQEGVWVAGRGIWYVSAAHGDEELQVALDRIDQAFESFAAGRPANTRG